ncbi:MULTISPECIES: hypothetical protein [unclassified Mesorhizobium]|uniref:hypothetical protein n=1 Tax=unclassified Mesorhizobium TaxID=325217 RepID=UPI001FE13402|nr:MULTISPECIES: hypothetical protein [unclassified Mesorhizobium]
MVRQLERKVCALIPPEAGTKSVSRLIGLISGRFEEVSAFGWLEQMADIGESLADGSGLPIAVSFQPQ